MTSPVYPKRRGLSYGMRHLFATVMPLACAALAPADAGAQATGGTISPAETLLFETDHLARVKVPAVLVYDFRKVSNVEPGFGDKVQLDLAAGNGNDNGKTSATLHFLSGAHKHETPALDDAHGNPVLLGFLERDIAEMKRLTGGSTAYFRKRIRMALADNAQLSTQSITYDGKLLPAQVVRIQPYLNDPMHARFEPYVHKTYTFIVSDGVPGGVYRLKSSLANGDGTTVAGSATATAANAAGASTGLPAAGSAAPGHAVSGKGGVDSSAVAGAAATPAAAGMAAHTGAAGAEAASPAATAHSAAAGAAAAGSPAAGARAAGAVLPAIDETLTLVSVAHPKR